VRERVRTLATLLTFPLILGGVIAVAIALLPRLGTVLTLAVTKAA
jgi:hypothetical protein